MRAMRATATTSGTGLRCGLLRVGVRPLPHVVAAASRARSCERFFLRVSPPDGTLPSSKPCLWRGGACSAGPSALCGRRTLSSDGVAPLSSTSDRALDLSLRLCLVPPTYTYPTCIHLHTLFKARAVSH
eukprot:1004398-Prymnesium_polylepis.1